MISYVARERRRTFFRKQLLQGALIVLRKANAFIHLMGLACFWQSIINQLFPPGVFGGNGTQIALHSDYSAFVLLLLSFMGIGLSLLEKKRGGSFLSSLPWLHGATLLLFFLDTLCFIWIEPESTLYYANTALNAALYALALLLLAVGWTSETSLLESDDFLKLGALSMLCSILLGLATSLVQEITQWQSLRIQMLFPWLSALLLTLLKQRPISQDRRLFQTSVSLRQAKYRAPFAACAILALYLLSSSFYWSVATEGMSSAFSILMRYPFHKLILLAIAVVFAIAAFRRPQWLEKGALLLTGYFVICIVALYCVAIFWETASFVCSAVILPTRAFSIFLLWLLLADGARKNGMSAERAISAIFLPIVSLCWLVVYLSWEVWGALSDALPSETLMLIFTLSSALVLMVAIFIYLNALKSRNDRSGQEDKKSEEVTEDRIAILSRIQGQYHLTDREADVLRLLLEGNTQKKISQLLCVSLSSVQSYSKSLYLKLGVHSKQQAIDLVRSFTDVR